MRPFWIFFHIFRPIRRFSLGGFVGVRGGWGMHELYGIQILQELLKVATHGSR